MCLAVRAVMRAGGYCSVCVREGEEVSGWVELMANVVFMCSRYGPLKYVLFSLVWVCFCSCIGKFRNAICICVKVRNY